MNLCIWVCIWAVMIREKGRDYLGCEMDGSRLDGGLGGIVTCLTFSIDTYACILR